MSTPSDPPPRGERGGAEGRREPPGLDPFDDDSPAAARARARRERRRATSETDALGPGLGAGGPGDAGERAAGARGRERSARPRADGADGAAGSRGNAGGRAAAGARSAASAASGAAARARARAAARRGGARRPAAAGAGGAGAAALLVDRRLRLLVPAVALLLFVVVLVQACGGPSAEEIRAERAAREAARPQLPGGGRTLFPDHRVVAFTGAPQDEALGALGVGSLSSATAKLRQQARPYARRTRPTMPALHLISTIAQADGGQNGRYSQRQSSDVIERHLRAARATEGLLVLDVQPGRADFETETKRLERWLREPDVALALDPEWRVQAGEVPGQVIGSVGAAELQASFDEVARVVRENDLPPKLVVVHRFTEDMIRGLQDVRVPAGVVPVMSIDGVGGREVKEQKYRELTRDLPRGWRTAFKLFYEEDAEAGTLMTPDQVMALRPRPSMVIYE